MKIILNVILILIALSSIAISIFKEYDMTLKCISFATASVCLGVTVTNKNLRYILAGIALILLIISCILRF